jgi:hypothetical protein
MLQHALQADVGGLHHSGATTRHETGNELLVSADRWCPSYIRLGNAQQDDRRVLLAHPGPERFPSMDGPNVEQEDALLLVRQAESDALLGQVWHQDALDPLTEKAVRQLTCAPCPAHDRASGRTHVLHTGKGTPVALASGQVSAPQRFGGLLSHHRREGAYSRTLEDGLEGQHRAAHRGRDHQCKLSLVAVNDLDLVKIR